MRSRPKLGPSRGATSRCARAIELEAILFDELGLPVLKKTPKGGRSTDAEVLEELAEQHDLPRVVVEYREIDKLKGTYIDALPRAINPQTGRIHTRFQQTVAATGRLLRRPIRTFRTFPSGASSVAETAPAFVAPPGSLIVSADYSQIKLQRQDWRTCLATRSSSKPSRAAPCTGTQRSSSSTWPRTL